MIWALLAIYVFVALVWLDVRRIEKRAALGPIHEADVRAAARPNGHVEVVGGGFRVR